MRTRIKICGFTRVEDAVAAAALGVDAVGLVFYPPSPRHVEIGQAKKIAEVVPAFVSTVGLFVDAEKSFIDQVLQSVSIDVIQFHGDETPDFCRSFNKPYIKAIRMRADVDLHNYARHYADAKGLLLDAYDPGLKGGSGKCFNWDRIPGDLPLPVILAGGLNTDNASKAVTEVRPYALDVSSGVEVDKGVKDKNKMATFITEVNQGDRH